MNLVINQVSNLYIKASGLLNFLQPVSLLLARLYVAWVFFASGLTKIKDWETTLWLFEEEYSVPFFSPQIAAVLGTLGELVLPVLLALGLATRFSALGLTIVNIVAVISLEEIAPAAHTLHLLWAVLLAQLVIFGAGKLSVDYLSKYKLNLAKPR